MTSKQKELLEELNKYKIEASKLRATLNELDSEVPSLHESLSVGQAAGYEPAHADEKAPWVVVEASRLHPCAISSTFCFSPAAILTASEAICHVLASVKLPNCSGPSSYLAGLVSGASNV